MKRADRRVCGPDRARHDSISRIYRAAWLYGGIPFLVLTAVLIAVRRASGLADFLFWLSMIWIVIVRYVESGCVEERFLQPSRAALRQWRRFSAILVMGGVVLYVLVRTMATAGSS